MPLIESLYFKPISTEYEKIKMGGDVQVSTKKNRVVIQSLLNIVPIKFDEVFIVVQTFNKDKDPQPKPWVFGHLRMSSKF